MSAAQYRDTHGGIKWVYLTPLFYAPVLPMSTFEADSGPFGTLSSPLVKTLSRASHTNLMRLG